ncbi:MAG: glycosyltransferase family 87 protein, partial [Acidobacteriota bacterium]
RAWLDAQRAVLRPATDWLRRILLALSIASVVLWLLPIFSSHSVLFPPGPNFEDILIYRGRFTLYHTAKFFTSRAFSGFAYPAGSAPIYAAFYATGDGVAAYFTIAVAASIAALAATFFYLRRYNLAHLFPWLIFFTFPLVWLIQRANIELILILIVATGILAYYRSLTYVAAILFGLAAAMKLYPILLLGLFLSRKRDLPAFLTGIFTALLSMAAAIEFSGPTFTIAAQGFANGLNRFQSRFVNTVSPVELAFDHSLFSPIKWFAYAHHASSGPYMHPYYLLAGAFAALLFLRVRTLPSLNRVIFLTTAMLALPPVSFSYTLVHLYLPTIL